MNKPVQNQALLKQLKIDAYKWGFETDIEMDILPKGLNEDIIRSISARKSEPNWMLEWRLKSYRLWLTMEPPQWGKVAHPEIDYQDLHYYAAPKKIKGPKSLDEVDPELLKTYAKLGISLREQEILAGVEKTENKDVVPVAIDAVFDSVSIATTFKVTLAKAGVVFCSISEAIQNYPEMIQKYLGSVVPQGDNY